MGRSRSWGVAYDRHQEVQREGLPLTEWQAAVDGIKADLPYPATPNPIDEQE